MSRWPVAAGMVLLAACGRTPDHPRVPATSPPAVATIQRADAPAPIVADATPRDDAWVLPGAFAPDRDLAWLRRRFGAANVRVGQVPGAEGELFPGVVLYPDDPTRRAYLYFQDETHLRGLSLVRVLDAPSRWRLDNGVQPGMPLAGLVALNGAPIRFSGFDWDYGGAIADWKGGRLAPRGDDPVRRGIQLGHGEAPTGSYPLGDAEFASDDPRYPRLGQVAIVGAISVSFPGEDDL